VTAERIDNVADAERLAKKYKPVPVKNVNPDDHVGPRQVYQVTATGMNGVQVDLGKLDATEKRLAALHEQLVRHLETATGLTGPLKDGSSPVTGPMRHAFLQRADAEGGVQKVLRDYLSELARVRVAILQTLATYEAMDSDAADLLNAQIDDLNLEI
jgi:hypothetical protein